MIVIARSDQGAGNDPEALRLGNMGLRICLCKVHALRGLFLPY